MVNKQNPELWWFLMVLIYEYDSILVYISVSNHIFIQTANYHDLFNPMTAKYMLYSVDLNLNYNASWKKESTWFDSADQSIGMSACNKHD